MKGGGCVLKLLKSQKGSVIVEAAFLYPLIIVASVSLLFIMVSFYQMTALKAELDVIALSESGQHSGIYLPAEGTALPEGERALERSGLYEMVTVTRSRSYGDWGILKRTEEKVETGEFISLKESTILRGTALLNGGE